MPRLSMEERAAYRVEMTQEDIDSFHVFVADPTGKSWAQWWVIPQRETVQRYDWTTHAPAPQQVVTCYLLCSRPGPDKDGHYAVIREFKDYDQATRHTMLRARRWLGSKWGLRTPARKLP